MKERVSSAHKDRTYDAEGYSKRAGCLCFKTDSEKEVLLVTSNRFPDQWIVPAGGVEDGEQFRDAAIREVLEEAGVRGNIVRSLGLFQNDISRKRTMLYVLIVNEELDVWQDGVQGGRRRGWFSIQKAWELLSHRPFQQSYLHEVINSQCKAEQFRPGHQHNSFWTSQNRLHNSIFCAPCPL